MKKRLLEVLFALLVLTFTMVVAVQAADYSEFTIAVEAGEIDEDGYVNVDIMMYNNPGIYVADINVVFDNTRIQIVNYKKEAEGSNQPDTCLDNTYKELGLTTNLDPNSGIAYEEINSIGIFFLAHSNPLPTFVYDNGSIINLTFRMSEGVNFAEIGVSIDSILGGEGTSLYEIDNLTIVPGTIVRKVPDYSGICGENLTWELYLETGLLEIFGTGEMIDYTSNSSVPWDAYRDIITTVKIYDGVTKFSKRAFIGCANLTYVSIGDSVISIDEQSFANCKNLTDIDIGNSVTNIGTRAFGLCYNLSNLNIPSSVTQLGIQPFLECRKLTTITVDENSESFCDINGVLFSKDKKTIIAYPAGKIEKEYVIPNGVTLIEVAAFQTCRNLEKISIPDSVTKIGMGAFNVTAYWSNEANWENNGTVLYIGKHLIESKINISGSYSIKEGTKTIAMYAFRDCTELVSLTIPESVTSINSEAFFHCDSLVSITIPDSVTSIGDYVFGGCNSLASVIIPDSVTSIGNDVFDRCDNLTNVYVYKNSYAEEYCLADETLINKIIYIPTNTDSFMTFDGYQVRDADYNGLRSLFTVDFTAMPTLENGGFEVVEVGAIFASTDKLTASGDEFIIAKGEDGTYKTVSYGVTVPVMKNGALVNKYISKTENELVFACTITNFTESNYNKKVSSRGYVVLADAEGNEYVVYCDYPDEEYRSVSLEMICDALFEAGQITSDNISYTHVVAFRKED